MFLGEKHSVKVIKKMPIKLNLVTIDEARINDVQEMYFMWKELCLRIKSCSSRAVNFPETISEVIVCWVLGLKWNKGSNCDAINEETELKIEIKASSSSGPLSKICFPFFLCLYCTTYVATIQ